MSQLALTTFKENRRLYLTQIPFVVVFVLVFSDVRLLSVTLLVCLLYVNIRLRCPALCGKYLLLAHAIAFLLLLRAIDQWYRLLQVTWVTVCACVAHVAFFSTVAIIEQVPDI